MRGFGDLLHPGVERGHGALLLPGPLRQVSLLSLELTLYHAQAAPICTLFSIWPFLAPPLAQRLHTDFDTDIRFDNPRAPQIRLRPCDFEMLMEVVRKLRDLFAYGSSARERILQLGDDALIESLAKGVSGTLGGKTGIAPRIFLKKLVADVLDRIELHETFDPRKDYRLTIRSDELSAEERNSMPASSVEDIRLEL